MDHQNRGVIIKYLTSFLFVVDNMFQITYEFESI